jgi:hypothetical protein
MLQKIQDENFTLAFIIILLLITLIIIIVEVQLARNYLTKRGTEFLDLEEEFWSIKNKYFITLLIMCFNIY